MEEITFLTDGTIYHDDGVNSLAFLGVAEWHLLSHRSFDLVSWLEG